MQEEREGKEKSPLKGLGAALQNRKFKKENFLVLFLMGILLLVVVWPVSGKKTDGKDNESGLTDMEGDMLSVGAAQSAEKQETGQEGYGENGGCNRQMEEALGELLSTMEGAGKVKVMITYKGSAESVVEKDAVTARNGTTEVDSAGGSRNTTQIQDEEETVYAGEKSGGQTPFVKQVLYPPIEGVLVSAQGGDNKAVIKNITEAIQALFGVEVHKIKVIKMTS